MGPKNRKMFTVDSLERDEVGRFRDGREWVQDIKLEDLDAEVDKYTALDRMYGPGFLGTIFDTQTKNIYTGDKLSSGHHASDNSAKTRAHFREGYPGAPMQCFCQQIKQWSVTIAGACGNLFTFESPGCTIHRNALGRGRNDIFVRLKNGQPLTNRIILYPWEVEEIEREHAEATQPDQRAIENEELREEAELEWETSGTYQHEFFNSKRRAKTYEEPEKAPESTLEELKNDKLQKLQKKMKAKTDGLDLRKMTQARSGKQKEEEDAQKSEKQRKKEPKKQKKANQLGQDAAQKLPSRHTSE
ncbi:hypothetical protein P171DRAFT_479883 [Karstenula rhodostoma CBS 690.94]|uniref:Uncharacterized protein n=1 Tax=Karstenula rhodostoma CBS 690.94 TaxID=1392251 RepID=A0A9P4UHN2_9PLEO|nr:hypothetical protein P171DRAFT_479883 [Karstenula rhodostoma CBS 690.94]